MVSLTAKILTFIFLSASMLSIGIQFSFSNFLILFKQKLLLLKSLLANFIFVPVIAFLIINTFNLPEEVSLAIIILALTPGGLSSIQFASKIKEETTYMSVMILILSLLAAFVSPVFIAFFLPPNITLVVPYFNIILFFLLFLVLPVMIGMIIKRLITAIAKRLSNFFALIGTVAFILMIIETLSTRRLAISQQNLMIMIVMLLFILLTMLLGWMMGGPNKKDRQALTIITSMRNLAICLAIAIETMPEAKVIVPLIALGALMVFPNMLFTLFVILRNRKK